MTCRILSELVLALVALDGVHGGDKTALRFPPLRLLWTEGTPGLKGPLPAGVKDGQLPLDFGDSLRKMFNDSKVADVAGIVVYLPPAEKANGTAVVICPGGGYGHLAADHEGEDVARWLNSHGAAGIVLRYRLGPRYHYPTQLHDAQQAIRTVRANAKTWNIDPKRVGILGFSAGGHLASTAATQFDDDKPGDDKIASQSSRPDFAILMYPVIRLDGPFSHAGSRTNLLGKDAKAELVESLNNDKRVTDKTPPTFLVHTTEDKAVPPGNSVAFYQALVSHKVPAELHIFEQGAHGLGLGPADLPYSSWPTRCAAWMTGRGLLKKGS